jgi:hypothetical protein
MSSPRSRHLLGLAGVVVCLVALTACGSGNNQPNAQATSTGTGQGQAGGVTSTPPSGPTTSRTTATTDTSAGNPGSSYPTSAKDYGLAMLQAIAGANDSKIVDLSSLNTANYIQAQNYKSKNGSWTWTDCSSGGAQSCNYYNQTGDFATIGVDTSKLGKSGAVTSVYIQGGNFATDAGSYVNAFVFAWINNSYVQEKAYANDTIINFVKTKTTPQGGFTTQPSACGTNRLCVDAGEYLAGGVPAGQIIHFVVDQTKLGKPNAIISASA